MCDYPHLEHGTLSSLALYEKEGRFEWTSVLKNTGIRLRARGPSVNVFPATRPPPLRLPHTTITQRSEQGASFLRTHLPDVDIASDLIRDEIAADARLSRELQAFDPHVGNQFRVVHCQNSSSSPSVFLAFPMGELNRSLNISPYRCTQGQFVFKPSGIAIRTFETPIQQIVSSNSSMDHLMDIELKSNCLAVRDFTSTSFFEVKTSYHGSSKSVPGVQLTEIVKIHPSNVRGKPIVDVNLSCSTPGAGVLVDQSGGVYRYDLNIEGSKPQLVYASETTPDDMVEGCLWRLASTMFSNGCLLASNRLVKLLDFRTDTSCLNLFPVQHGLVTSIESSRSDHIFRLASTSEILWFDKRSPRKPLLSFKHGRRFDRSLELQTVDLMTPLTFLTSRKNGLVTVYDVSSSDDRLIQVNVSPYALPSVLGHHETNAGHIVFRHLSDPNKTKLRLLRLCEQGSIHSMDLLLSANDDDDSVAGHNSRDFEWSEDVKELHRRSTKLRPNIGPLGARDVSSVDFRASYEKLFILGGNALEWGKERDPEAVYEILEKMPVFWQESDGQADSMLTLFDIVFRSGEEPTHICRADFLTQCAINSTRGYRALAQGRIPYAPLIKKAPWYSDILPILHQHIDYSEDPRIFVDNLHRYDLTYTNPCPQILRRETQAREQLALDLALSAHIFSPQSFATSADLDTLETMSRATEALSLSDEPPPIQFGYLRPIPKCVSEDLVTSLPERLTSPLGVRLLLQEWEIGTDPLDFVFQDPYDRSIQTKPDATGTTSRAAHAPMTAKTHLPPTVVASNTFQPAPVQPESFTRSQFITRSQGPMSRHSTDSNGQSTGLDSEIDRSLVCMTSTQILPGPYGGRLPLGKKKMAKRIGGF